MERKKHDVVACGEIEAAHPGYLGSQDTPCVGTFKGVGRIYQQTFIDTCPKIAFAKLYATKTPITAAGMLNDRVLPFFEHQALPMLRILTDKGTAYCGRADQHDYQLYLALNDIKQTKTKLRSPQTNGICECFHKTILQEFYQMALRKNIYTDLASLQADLLASSDFFVLLHLFLQPTCFVSMFGGCSGDKPLLGRFRSTYRSRTSSSAGLID